MTDQLIEDPALRQRYRFETVDGVLHVELWVDPGGGVTPHVHPAMEERFTVVDGRAELLAGRRWRPAGPGDVVLVPPGTRHAFRNRSDAVVHLRAEARPPSTLQAFLTEVAELSQAGKISHRGLPTSPRAALETIALAHRHRDMVVLGFPLPPAPVQRLLFGRLARLAQPA